MKRASITAQQVAKKAGVSQTTVSFVLNNTEGANISDATRQRVIKAADDLGYVPHAAARFLAQGHSNNIGFVTVLPHERVYLDPFVPNVISGITDIIQPQDFRLQLLNVREDTDQINVINMVRGGEIEGLIMLSSYWHRSIVDALQKEDTPFVMLDHFTDPELYSTTIDHEDGIKQVAEHIAGLGYVRIACIGYAPNSDPHVNWRLSIFREHLDKFGVTFDDALMRYGAFDPSTGYEAMQDLLKLPRHPEAVFCMNDMMAIGAIRAIFNAGLRIPEDIALVGYDDIRAAAYITPPLTTFHAPEYKVGISAAEMLMDIINQKPITENHVRLRGKLIIRDSCGAKLSHQ